ncbi:MAG TPA: hypothetical protein VKZ42_00130 [Flavobacteriaceae bacterium]|nr:hypothetical protein [Flavobacteriaceae bacterium]
MKLIIITAVKEYTEDVKEILKNENITTFSYSEVTGYRDSTLDDLENNWFGSEMNKSESVLFFAFVTNMACKNVYETIREFNKNITVTSKIHMASVLLDKTNTI